MKNVIKKIFLILLLFFVVFVFDSQNSKTQANSEYRVYTPNEFSNIQQSVSKASLNEQILFIVDFSNSMNERIHGVSKVDMARSTLAEILHKIPPNIKTGLRVYGYKSGFTYLQGCQASKLLVPMIPNNPQTILGALYATNAVGWTPITYSLKHAIENDFAGHTGLKHIILLTDGGENCDESPCTFVIELMKQRDDVKIDVIAFDIHDIEANNQLKCTALMTRGKFLPANSQESLSNSLFESVGITKEVKGTIKIQP